MAGAPPAAFKKRIAWTSRSASFSVLRYSASLGMMLASGFSSSCLSTAARTFGSGSASSFTSAAVVSLPPMFWRPRRLNSPPSGSLSLNNSTRQRLIGGRGQAGQFVGGLLARAGIGGSQSLQAARPAERQRIGGHQAIAEGPQPLALCVGRSLFQPSRDLRQQRGAVTGQPMPDSLGIAVAGLEHAVDVAAGLD